MLHPASPTLQNLETRLVALSEHRHDARPESPFLTRLDRILPAENISTWKYATETHLIPDGSLNAVRVDPKKTPYTKGIVDALDMPGVRVVGVQASSRWSKTLAWECKLAKNMTYGPRTHALFYMQSKDDLQSYVDERFQWMIENNEGLAALIDGNDSRNGRFRVDFAGALIQMFAATQRTLRGKSAPLIGCDEIDAMDPRVRKGLLNLVLNRQREHGGNAKAYFASHPDAGMNDGIAKIIADGMRHLWFWTCLDCGGASSPAKEADENGLRMTWNINGIVKAAAEGEIDRLELLRLVERDARLVCPHCGSLINDRMRLEMSGGGAWLQPHQTLERQGAVIGEAKVSRIMGFIGHAFMSPFVKVPELASEWASAMLTFRATQDDKALREVEVKSLGMVFESGADETKIDDWKIVQQRLAAPFVLKTVPEGVLFLTAFVDVQGDRFEVRVWGWNLQNESWLIDAYAIKQWPGFDNIDPSNRLKDWEIIEQAVLNQTYPLAGDATKRMPIAKTAVNNAGAGAATNKGRQWLSNALNMGRFESYRVILFQGAASKVGERYGRPRQVTHDDLGRPLQPPVLERAPNVHELKLIAARRMRVEVPGTPGKINFPSNLPPRYAREMTAERLINGEWVRMGANETWDGYIGGELARELLKPDRSDIDWAGNPPVWARPISGGATLGGDKKPQMNYFDRLAQLNTSDE